MTKKEKAALARRIQRVAKDIASSRDELRELLAEAETLADISDRATEALECAVDALSEQV